MKIAIQGHPTRGKEVIKILKSLGGKNREGLEGYCKTFYYIDDKNVICDDHEENFPSNYKLYTLEEFEKEFPFKVGDEVMFPVKVGWASGKITGLTYVGDQLKYEVDNRIAGYRYIEPRILQLYSMKEERNITLTLDKAKEWYKKGGELQEIALQAFNEQELNPLPKSWEEFCEKYPIQDHEAFINYANGIITVCKECAGSGLGIWKREPEKDRCKCPSKKSAEAHLAMIQLEQLRDCYRNSIKMHCSIWYKIYRSNDKYAICPDSMGSFLSFPTESLAIQFLNNFKDLIIKAGDLI